MSFRLRQLITHLNYGAIIAYPTETIWGLGCSPNHLPALQRLASIKQRPHHKGFILVSPNIEYCLPYIDSNFHALAIKNIKLNIDQPTTWLAPKAQNISSLISGEFHTVAIRITSHPFISKACDALQTPLISTSANIHTRPSLNSALLIQKIFGYKIDHIINGYKNGSGQASTIINLQSKRIVRK